MQDRPDPDDEEAGQDGDAEKDPDEDDIENDEEFMETFLAAWSAKKKTNQQRLQCGFGPQRDRGRKPGAATTSKSARSASPDPRKAASRCAECKQLGHWKGDPERSRVQEGKTQRFEKSEKKPRTIDLTGVVA